MSHDVCSNKTSVSHGVSSFGTRPFNCFLLYFHVFSDRQQDYCQERFSSWRFFCTAASPVRGIYKSRTIQVNVSGNHIADVSVDRGQLSGQSAGHVIQRSRVRVLAETAGRSFSPGSIFCADSYLGNRSTPVLPQQQVKDPGHSAKSAVGRLQLHTHEVCVLWLCMKGRDMVHGCLVYTECAETAAVSCRNFVSEMRY